MFYLLVCFVGVCVFFDGLACFKIRKEQSKKIYEQPLVSILIAIRNEEDNILHCLQSLNQLSYPRLEILIGDDNSTDNSLNIVHKFIKDKPHFTVFQIKNQIGNAIAKANVLAQLAHQAKGKWLFITDADVQVPPNWIEDMLSSAEEASIVTGFTWVEGKGLFAILQALDWTFALAVAKTFSYWNVPITAMGNNMAVRKEAYWQTGGYENLAPTLVEDFILFKNLTMERKHRFRQIFASSVMAKTQAIRSIKDFFWQRKRWTQGASKAHWLAKLYLFFKIGFYPVFLLSLFLIPQNYYSEIAFLYMLKLFWQSIALYRFLYLLGKRQFIWAFGLYELYLAVLSCTLPVYSLLILENRWKGRIF
ncbi:MAG: glycosyltransferase family 2 protein [Raineya sp.]